MTFEELEKGINEIWMAKLVREWYIQIGKLHDKMGKPDKPLEVPNFCIGKAKTRWGQWNQERRMIEISSWLLRNFEWNATVDTLKHEMAHQLVDEYLNHKCDPHGEAFKFACKLLGVDDSRCTSSSEMSFITGGDEGIIVKIKKLLAKGSDDAVTELEGEIFLQKAQELMIRYNLDIADLSDSGQFYVQIPVTPIAKRWPDYYYTVGQLMAKQYNVQYIRYNTHEGSYLEYFGEPSNVEVAVYVTHVLLQQGEHLYKEFLKEHRERRDNSWKTGESYIPKASQAAFMNGLINGYGRKLANQRDAAIQKVQNQMQQEKPSVSEAPRQCQDILLASSKILEEHFKNHYKPRNSHRNGCHGAGYAEGSKAGANISINQGVQAATSGKMIGN
jgi:hypothetical protein